MPQAAYDCVVRGGRVGTAVDEFEADIGILNGAIAAIGRGLPAGAIEIDASNKLVLPGGVDAHAHIEQLASSGILNADTFESATTAAAFGGTTTVMCFAAQHRGMNLATVAADYMALARKGAVVDYTFHLVITDANEVTLKEHVPQLVAQGHSTLKVFMTYDLLNVGDEGMLDILLAARRSQALVCVHAENHGMITWMGKRLLEKGYTAPKFHTISHPRGSEAEAIYRLVTFAELVDQPIMIFHVSSAEGVAVIRQARGRGLKVFAETCPQYLFMTGKDLDKPGMEGAKWMCSPPPRVEADHEAIWQGLELGDLQVVSSDHAPYRFDETGKLVAGPSPTFKQVPNGIPGIELRLPLLFDAMVSRGRLGLAKFVELTATAPARIYNLHPRKGSIAVGGDADLVVWDPRRRVTISDGLMHDRTGYTPFAGRTLTGWPETVMRRGEVIVRQGRLEAKAGSGMFLPRSGGAAAAPLRRRTADMDPALNFGAEIL
jgi:dihydropyrimidinase